MEETPPRESDAAVTDDWWWIFDPRHSLRARASLIFGGGAVVFTVLLGWIAGGILRRQIETQLGTSFETLAFQVSDKIDRTIYERHRELRFAAGLTPFRVAAAAPLERRQVLESLQAIAPDFAWLGFADGSGRIVAATHGLMEGTTVAERMWFRSARENVFAGALHEFPELAREIPAGGNEPPRFLDLAVPVTGADGHFLGVLGAHVSWEWARDVQFSVLGEAARRERLGVTIYSPTGEMLLDSGGSGWSQPPDAPAIPGPRRFRGTLLEYPPGDTTYVTGYVRSRGFREYHGLGWLVTVRQPADYAFAPVSQLQRSIARWGFGFAAAFMVMSWLFAAQFVRQMQRIAATANRIRGGDILTVMPRPRNESEFARMCAALGRMVDDFRLKQEALSADNSARTVRQSDSKSPAASPEKR